MTAPGAPERSEAGAPVALRPCSVASDPAFAHHYRDYLGELDAYAPERADWELHLRAWAEEPDLDAWWIVPGEADEPVGFLLVRVLPDWPDPARLVAEIAECYIAPPHRRTGLGRAAVEALIETLRARGVHEVEASILSANEPAAAFWSALGFDARSVTTTRRI